MGLIVGLDGRPLDAQQPAQIVAPDGEPVTSQPPDDRPATMEDLKQLLVRMGAAADRLSPNHPHRQLFIESAQWLANLAKQLVMTQQHFATLVDQQQAAQARDWRGHPVKDGGTLDEDFTATHHENGAPT